MMTRERFRRRRAGVRTVVVSSTYEVLVQPVAESTRWEDLRRGRWQAQVTYVPEPGCGGGGDPAIVGTAHARTVDEAVHAGRALALGLEHGPITNAGAVTNLGYSQSGLSQRIQTLEHMVGCRLFIRGPQGVKPTQDGTTTLPYARMLLTIAEALHHELGRNRRPNNRR
jgi:hypothetical protein